jgi:hypothetical protein
MSRGRKKGAANQPLEAKRRGGRTAIASMSLEARQLGAKNQSREDKQRAGRLGGKRSGATRRAKAAAAELAELVAEADRTAGEHRVHALALRGLRLAVA